MKTGLESLDTGAPEITYSGNEGPKSPQQIQQMQMAQLEEEYNAYVDDMLEQGLEPMSMQQFLEQIAAEAQMSSNEEGIGSMMEDPRQMAADGGVMQLVKKNKDGSRPGYRGVGGYRGGPGGSGGGIGREQAGSAGSGFETGQNVGRDPNETKPDDRGTPTQNLNQQRIKEEAERRAKEKEAEEKAAKEKREAEETAQTRSFFERIAEARTKSAKMKLAKSMNKKLGLGLDPKDDDFLNQVTRAGETMFSTPDMNDPFAVDYDMGSYGLKGTDLAVGKKQFGVMGQDRITQEDFENVYRPYNQMFIDGEFTPGPIIRGDTGGGGGGGQQTQQPATPPATPPGNGLPDIPTDFVDLSGTQSYTNPAFGGQYFYGTPTITLANGGRANFAGGGIADLRQGYFLGKLVKSITKPFKKAFKGFKKIAKSPLGKMALLALGGYYLGGGTKLGGSLFGNQGFGTSKLAGMFTGGGGGGGGGGQLNWWEDTWTIVATSSFFIRGSSYTTQSSTTYQRFGAMKHKGSFGGIFDPWTANNNGGPHAKGFFVNQTTGAITEGTGSNLWNHNYSATFTTLHRGNVGNDYVVRGGCTNPSYGSSYRDWWYGARFNSSGNVASQSYSQGSPSGDYAEHSNGDLAMSQTSVNGTTYFRRSGYNRNDSRYWHSRGEFSGNGGSYNEWSNASSTTSTNYCTSFAPQERGSNPYGCIWWYNSSNQQQWSGLYGNGLTRGGTTAVSNTTLGWHGNCHGFVLSNGFALMTAGGTASTTALMNTGNGAISAPPSGASYSILSLMAHTDYSQAVHLPRPTWPEVNDSWMVATNGKGYILITIDPNTLNVTVKTAKDSTIAGLGSTPPKNGNQMTSITGSTNQYYVYAAVSSGKANITVYENPFKDVDMS